MTTHYEPDDLVPRTVNPLAKPAPNRRPRPPTQHSLIQIAEAHECLYDPNYRESAKSRQLRRQVLEARDPAQVDAITGLPKPRVTR